MPVQLNWLGAIVSLKTPDINVQMLNAYQARPDYEAITLLPDAGQALCAGGRIAGQPGARWKPMAPPQLAMEFDFRAGMGKRGCWYSHTLRACIRPMLLGNAKHSTQNKGGSPQ